MKKFFLSSSALLAALSLDSLFARATSSSGLAEGLTTNLTLSLRTLHITVREESLMSNEEQGASTPGWSRDYRPHTPGKDGLDEPTPDQREVKRARRGSFFTFSK